MADSSTSVQQREARPGSLGEGQGLRTFPGHDADPFHPDRVYVRETFGPRHATAPEGLEPFSLQWFLHVEELRHRRHARWLPSALEFAKHSGETLLGLDSGVGTDWVEYARHGASIVACCPLAEQVALVKRHFELRGLPGRFVQASWSKLPVESSSIDVVHLGDTLGTIHDPEALIAEAYRVLKPGGKVLALAPARFDITFWRRILLPWRWRPLAPRSGADTPFTARLLRSRFHRFVEHRVHKRHLRRADVPHVWRLVPTSMLQRMIGRILVLKAFKPLSAAISIPLAA